MKADNDYINGVNRWVVIGFGIGLVILIIGVIFNEFIYPFFPYPLLPNSGK